MVPLYNHSKKQFANTVNLDSNHSFSTSIIAFPERKSVLTFPTLMRVGSGINVVPGSCEAFGDVRLLPGTSPEEIKRLIKEQLECFSIPTYQLEDLLEVPAAETDPQAEVVQTLAAAAAITGTHPRVEGSGPACDGWMFITRGFLFRSCLFRDTMHKGLHLCIRGGFLRSLIEVMAHKQVYSRRPGR